jgi:electron transfer flavoprotein beta subunit
MKIVVCIKQVPAVAEVRIDEGRWTLVRNSVPNQINDQDLLALDFALRLRDLNGGRVTVMTMGPPQSEEALFEALAMGADEGVLISDPALAGSDTLITSMTLARAIRKLDGQADLILSGARSSDSGTGQVGPQLAEDLGIPHVAYVEGLRQLGEQLIVQRRVDRYRETLKLSPPAVLTILRSENPTREVRLAMIEEAFRTDSIVRWSIGDLGLESHEVGLSGSATWVREIREPEGARRAVLKEADPNEAVQYILQALRERYMLD